MSLNILNTNQLILCLSLATTKITELEGQLFYYRERFLNADSRISQLQDQLEEAQREKTPWRYFRFDFFTQEERDLVAAGKRIAAIKSFRERTREGLWESKIVIEWLCSQVNAK